MSTEQPPKTDTPPELDAELCSLVHRFGQVLGERLHVLRCFVEQGVQVEGWLKGEILAFLTQEKKEGRLVDFDREVLIGQGRRKADLTLAMQCGAERFEAWVELKHYLIGEQKGFVWDAYGYFNDRSAGIKPDIDKLLTIPTSNRYVLILGTANPGREDWKAAIDRFNEKFQSCVRSLTDPTDFPDEFFPGLLAVTDN